MKISLYSLISWLSFPTHSSLMFVNRPSTLKFWGVVTSPADILPWDGQATGDALTLCPKSAFLEPTDYELSLLQQRALLSALIDAGSAEESLTNAQLREFYFQPVSPHLNKLIWDFPSFSLLLSSPFLEATERQAVFEYYEKNPQHLHQILPSSLEIVKASKLFELDGPSQEAFFDRHINITRDKVLLNYLSSAPLLEITCASGRIFSLEEYCDYAHIFHSEEDLQVFFQLADIYLRHSDAVIKQLKTLPHALALMSNVFLNSQQREKFLALYVNHPQGLSHHLCSLPDIQLARSLGLSEMQKDRMLKRSTYRKHPLTQFLEIFQGNNTETLAHQALYAPLDALNDLYVKDGFSLILQGSTSLNRLAELINHPLFSEEVRENLRDNCLKMDNDMLRHLITTTEQLCQAPDILGLDMRQRFALGQIYMSQEGLLFKNLEMNTAHFTEICEQFYLSSSQISALPEYYLESLWRRGKPFVKNYQEFEHEEAFFTNPFEPGSLSKIRKFYWHNPVKHLAPVIGCVEELHFMEKRFAQTEYGQNFSDFLHTHYLKQPRAHLFPLINSTLDFAIFMDNHLKQRAQDGSTDELTLQRHNILTAVLTPAPSPHIRKIAPTLDDLEMFFFHHQLSQYHRNLLWKALSHNHFYWLHQLVKTPRDMIFLLQQSAPSQDAVAQLADFYIKAPRRIGIESLAQMCQSLPQADQIGRLLGLDLNQRALLKHLRIKEHLSFMDQWAPTIEDLRYKLASTSDEKAELIAQMIATHNGYYFLHKNLSSEELRTLLALEWPTSLTQTLIKVEEHVRHREESRQEEASLMPDETPPLSNFLSNAALVFRKACPLSGLKNFGLKPPFKKR